MLIRNIKHNTLNQVSGHFLLLGKMPNPLLSKTPMLALCFLLE